MKLRIVLVEPHEAGNVGAVARVMKNFGFDDLWIVGTRGQRVDQISEWWASGASSLVHGAKRVEKLEDALADCHLSIATTAVRARQVFEQLTPPTVAELAATFESDQQLAIVFGREEWGLRNEEIALCMRTASVPTSPEFPTMNLAMTVGVFCYEMSKERRGVVNESEPAPGELLQRLHERAKEFLLEIGFLHQTNPDRMFNELRALAGRALLSKREASLLLALLGQVNWRIRKAEGSGEGREAKGEE
ncbi:MAG: RNA methyltransferase [Acidobacteria bacterium]|nr:RNA methyltransferase [Acidobacteriota bacterium]